MKKLLLAVLSLMTLNAGAQVSGKIEDEKGRPIPGAVVRLFNAAQIRKIVLTDTSGTFKAIVPDLHHVLITAQGYQNDTIYTFQKPLGAVRLSPLNRELKEVVVKARQPILKQEADRNIITVNKQVSKFAANGLDIISLAPGITISDNEEAILMSGKSDLQVMINNKLIKMSARDLAKMLKAMPSGSIRRVELLTNPPARYEVNGNTGLINIVTNGAIKGLTGNVDYSTSQSRYNWTDLSSFLNYGAGKLAVSGYGAWHKGAYLTNNGRLRQLSAGPLDQQTESLDKWSDPVFRIAADYQINSKNTLGGIIEREASANNSNYDTHAVQNGSSNVTTGRNPYVRHWNTYNVNYAYRDTSGSALEVDLDRADFIKNSDLTVLTIGMPPIDYGISTSISINTFKADYTYFWKKVIKLESGIKLSGVRTDNNQNAGLFVYAENIRALYASISGTVNKWSWQLGMRAEQTGATGKSEISGSEALVRLDTSYLNLLPSFYLAYAPGYKHRFRLSLSRRIRRPDYNDLQPFTYLSDPLDQQRGNPSLRVQKNDQAELTYTFDGRITLVINYSRSSDLFNKIYILSGDILIETSANTGVLNTVNFDLNYPLKINKWWNMLNKINAGNDHFNGALFQGQLEQGKWRYQISSLQRFNWPGKYQLQLSGRYTSASQNLIYYRLNSANVSASIGRKFLKEQASLRLGISDIFKTQRDFTDVHFGSLNYIDRGTFESRRVSFSFSWQFGNSKIRQIEDHKRGDTDEKSRGNG